MRWFSDLYNLITGKTIFEEEDSLEDGERKELEREQKRNAVKAEPRKKVSKVSNSNSRHETSSKKRKGTNKGTKSAPMVVDKDLDNTPQVPEPQGNKTESTASTSAAINVDQDEEVSVVVIHTWKTA